MAAVVVAVSASDNSSSDGTGVEKATEDDSGGGGGGGGILEGVFPYRALQLYNTVTGYLEYLYDIVIAPITSKWKKYFVASQSIFLVL